MTRRDAHAKRRESRYVAVLDLFGCKTSISAIQVQARIVLQENEWKSALLTFAFCHYFHSGIKLFCMFVLRQILKMMPFLSLNFIKMVFIFAEISKGAIFLSCRVEFSNLSILDAPNAFTW